MREIKYSNPIIFADYSDPDVVKVGDMFYMTASSFNYTPGLPILRSGDLVNWTLTGYAVRELGSAFSVPRHSEGIWAPSIRYINDRFCVYYGMPDEGLYVVRGRLASRTSPSELGRVGDDLAQACQAEPATRSASGAFGDDYDHGVDLHIPGFAPIIWENPVCVLPGKGLIDPCPYIDADGRFWLMHAYAKSRIGFKSVLGLVELDETGMRAIGPDHVVFNGNLAKLDQGDGSFDQLDQGDGSFDQLSARVTFREDMAHRFAGGPAREPDEKKYPAITIEGPKVYERDGYVYVLAPAGGVRYGWKLALRARDVHGPYECRIVMRQGDGIINGPHQGGLATLDGEDYFLHFQDLGPYGRVCHLQPVTWNDGWPVIGEPAGDGTWGMPRYAGHTGVSRAREDLGTGSASDVPFSTYHDYQWLGNYSEEYFAVFDDDENVVSEDMAVLLGGNSPYLGRKGAYRLKLQALNSQGADPVLWKCPNVLTRKLDRREFEVKVAFDVRKLQAGDRAGITFMGGEYAFLECHRKRNGRFDVRFGTSEGIPGTKEKKENVRILESTDADEFVVSVLCREADGGPKAALFTSVESCHPKAFFRYSAGAKAAVGAKTAAEAGADVDLGGIVFTDVAEEFTPSDHTWVGARVGAYAVSGGVRGGYAVIDAYEWD